MLLGLAMGERDEKRGGPAGEGPGLRPGRFPPVLEVTAWAALLREPGSPVETMLGMAAAEEAIPLALRRRMTRFERGAVRCGLGLAARPAEEELILCSRYGNMATALSLLRAIVDRDLLSPAAFSISVHNAAPGLLSQIEGNRAGHTALAAGAATLGAGLVEAYARLVAEGMPSLLLLYSDLPLPPIYAVFDEEAAGEAHLGLRLALPRAGPAVPGARAGLRRAGRGHGSGARTGAGCPPAAPAGRDGCCRPMMQALDQGWRLLGTGLSFAIFGLGGLVLALTVFPLLTLLVRDPARCQAMAQAVVHRAWWLYVRAMAFLGVLTFRCEGEEILRRERGVLIVANHPSLLDIVFIMSFMERTQCVVKGGVWRNPFMRGVVRATRYIPNLGDPERLIEDCAAALRSGNNLVIFPEGSRTVPGQQGRMQRGFAYVALRAAAPIRLVTIRVDPPTLLKGEPWHRIPPRRPHWQVRVHERIEPADHTRYEQPSIAVRKLSAHVQRRLEELLQDEQPRD